MGRHSVEEGGLYGRDGTNSVIRPRGYLIYTKGTRPTGKQMADLLEVERGIKTPYPNPPVDVLIRWGSRRHISGAGIVINSSRAIGNASNKVIALSTIRDEGIETVTWSKDWAKIAKPGRIIFGRSATGMQGRDIVIYDPGDMYAGQYPKSPPASCSHDFYSVYFADAREYRIHVVDGQVIRAQAKYLDFPEKEGDGFIKNYAHGYRFRAPKRNLRTPRREAAIGAVKALGLDFGAVDILVTGRGQYVLEVNTAPACSPLTARCYAAAIALLVQRKSGNMFRLAPALLEAEVEAEAIEDDDANEW